MSQTLKVFYKDYFFINHILKEKKEKIKYTKTAFWECLILWVLCKNVSLPVFFRNNTQLGFIFLNLFCISHGGLTELFLNHAIWSLLLQIGYTMLY